MAHQSENSKQLQIRIDVVPDSRALRTYKEMLDDTCLVILPFEGHDCEQMQEYFDALSTLSSKMGTNATLVVIGSTTDLVHAHVALTHELRYQTWIVIKRKKILVASSQNRLPQHHFGAVVYTQYAATLKHTKTRIKYTYCPACGKTTKDYGGKKHTYHHYGTAISDIWRDISVDPTQDLQPVIERFADFFGIAEYEYLTVLDCRRQRLNASNDDLPTSKETEQPSNGSSQKVTWSVKKGLTKKLIEGDCIESLKTIANEAIDFIFVDPPYNLGKKYTGYSDDLKITSYFEWCDEWLSELTRVLKPGRTLAILNIPLWSIRHFLHLETMLTLQNWIAWDALSYPVRRLMPAHYSILCFSKGVSRTLPGLQEMFSKQEVALLKGPTYFDELEPLAEGFCLRATCIKQRMRHGIDDRGPLTDLWWDIHRLKHNSRRVDHPTQLPPQLMYRLISIFTQPGEVVLDCFNGSGTTTLAAHQLGRSFIGIERESKYIDLAKWRHSEIEQGLDPFRKTNGVPKAKNSPVKRVKQQVYKIPKKTLQLEVRRVANNLGHIPTREELIAHGEYDIKYYDDYFVSWGEVIAAAKTTGMSELPNGQPD